jgi:hypothetical protein
MEEVVVEGVQFTLNNRANSLSKIWRNLYPIQLMSVERNEIPTKATKNNSGWLINCVEYSC